MLACSETTNREKAQLFDFATMSYLLVSVVFLLSFHISACEVSEDQYFWFIHEINIIKCKVEQGIDVSRLPAWYEEGLANDVCEVAGPPVPEFMISGPAFLITNGNTNLSLTIPASVLLNCQARSFTWFTPGEGRRFCTDRCTFLPKVKDDGKNVTCVTLNSTNGPSCLGYYTLDLKYPPGSAPNITKGPQGKNRVEGEEVIKCSVSGGKPPVTNVTLDCLLPNGLNKTHVSTNTYGQETVKSSVTFNSSRATDDDITCNCWASWAPRPALYSNITEKVFTSSTSKQSGSKASRLIAAVMTFVVIMCVI